MHDNVNYNGPMAAAFCPMLHMKTAALEWCAWVLQGRARQSHARLQVNVTGKGAGRLEGVVVGPQHGVHTDKHENTSLFSTTDMFLTVRAQTLEQSGHVVAAAVSWCAYSKVIAAAGTVGCLFFSAQTLFSCQLVAAATSAPPHWGHWSVYFV